jgi:hypothetical protein
LALPEPVNYHADKRLRHGRQCTSALLYERDGANETRFIDNLATSAGSARTSRAERGRMVTPSPARTIATAIIMQVGSQVGTGA